MVSSDFQIDKPVSALRVSSLTFGYKTEATPVIDNVSLSVEAGEIVSILGRSGCGKSTLLNLIAGLITPTAGDIRIDQHHSRCNIGYIFQEDALMPWRTIEKNLALAQEIGKVPKDAWQASLIELLARFHLDQTILPMYPSQLSGGMRQRVSIIQSLLFNPHLLLLDEPFAALDFFTKLRLEGEFYKFIKDTEKAAVLVTHDIEEAIAVSDHVVILNNTGSVEAKIAISFDSSERDPETIRGVQRFSEYYQQIWQQLKSVISQ